MVTDAELRLLLRDCLVLWQVPGRVTATDAGIAIDTPDGTFMLQPAGAEQRPVRWFLQTPVRAAAGRPPRAAPSIVAALSALRNAVGAAGGASLRIGAAAPASGDMPDATTSTPGATGPAQPPGATGQARPPRRDPGATARQP